MRGADQDLSCTYLAHHELESIVAAIVIVTVVLIDIVIVMMIIFVVIGISIGIKIRSRFRISVSRSISISISLSISISITTTIIISVSNFIVTLCRKELKKSDWRKAYSADTWFSEGGLMPGGRSRKDASWYRSLRKPVWSVLPSSPPL